MRPYLPWLLIACVSPGFSAENRWTFVTSSDNGGGDEIYVDIHTISARDRYLEAWILHSYTKPQSVGEMPPFLSFVDRVRVDCQSLQIGTLASAYYSDSTAHGSVVHSDDAGDDSPPMRHALPDSVAEATIKAICSSGPKHRP